MKKMPFYTRVEEIESFYLIFLIFSDKKFKVMMNITKEFLGLKK